MLNLLLTNKRARAKLLLLDNSQKFAADKHSIQSGISGFNLMENAATKAANFIAKHYPKGKVLVLAGFGNNGGDGLVVARLLAKHGRKVAVLGWQLAKAKAPEAKRAAQEWHRQAQTLPLNLENLTEQMKGAGVIVDALFGIGFRGNLPPMLEQVARVCPQNKVVALDCASIPASHTLAFISAQPIHYLDLNKTGKLKVLDIGVPESFWKTITPKYALNHPCLWQGCFKPLTRQSHKYSRGSVLISGGEQMSGAARLAAFSALKCLSGAATIAVPNESMALYAAARPEIILRTYKTASQWQAMCLAKNINAIAVGCGGGKKAVALARTALATKKPIVVDADAINESLVFHSNTIWTPHLGEFQRLYPKGSAEGLVNGEGLTKINGEALTKMNSEALTKMNGKALTKNQAEAVLVLKGSTTVIHKRNYVILNADASPHLATAGSGDVLSGIIASLLANGFEPQTAAMAGVWLHSKAAAILGAGLTAGELPQALPLAVNEASNCLLEL